MPSIDEIISTRDLVELFRTVVRRGEAMIPDRRRVVRRIRALAPLSVDDLEGFEDKDVLVELERHGRWSVLREMRRR